MALHRENPKTLCLRLTRIMDNVGDSNANNDSEITNVNSDVLMTEPITTSAVMFQVKSEPYAVIKNGGETPVIYKLEKITAIEEIAQVLKEINK